METAYVFAGTGGGQVILIARTLAEARTYIKLTRMAVRYRGKDNQTAAQRAESHDLAIPVTKLLAEARAGYIANGGAGHLDMLGG
jgi:hypothetical protein